MMQGSTNWQRLQDAGLIKPGTEFKDISEEDRNAIERLSVDEVNTLIEIGRKLGPDFLQRNVFTACIFF